KTELALRHEYLTRYANDIFLLANSSGNIVDANERAVSAYGYTREELARLCLGDLQEEESLPCMDAQLMKVREENGYIYEAINRRKDGTVFPVEVSARYVMLSDGEYYWATVRDVSERKRLEELLRKERDRAQDYLDIAAVSIVAVDSLGIITLVNREGCRITGYEGEELVGRKWAEFCVPGKALESLDARFEALMAGRIDTAGGCEFAVRNRAGASRLLAFHCTPLRNADSEITGLLVSGEDVTERRRADRERMVTIELFKIINSAKSTRQLVDGIALSLKDWAGCDAAALRMPCSPYFPHFDADAPPQGLDEEGGVPLQAEPVGEPGPNHAGGAFLDSICSDVLAGRFDPDNPLFTRHGSFWTGRASGLPAFPADSGRGAEHESIAVVPVRSGDQALGLLLFMRERPDRFSLEDVLFFERLADGFAVALAKTQVEEEWLQLAAAVEQAAESFLIIGANKNVRYANPAFERMSGYTRHEVLHRHISLFRSEFQGEAFFESIWRTALGAGVWNGTIILRKKDGSYLETEATISPVLDDRGEMINGIIIKRDLSPMRRLENQLRQSQKMEAIGTLAGGIAHDFNNILASIIGFTELALSDIPEDMEAYITLQQVLESADRAKELVRQILTVSRKSEQECRPVQVGLIVKEALKLLRASLPATIEVRHSISSEAAMGTTLADPTQIHQILMNLCTNAAHAMRKGGILRVALAVVSIEDSFADSLLPLAPGPFLRLSVSDTGHGIDEEVKQRIFEPYFTTKEQDEGTGLGLSVVYGIVKAINGGIGFESEPDKGTTFHVYFPRLESPGQRDVETSTPVPAGKGRILFLDDEPAIVLVGRRLLERLGFTVVAVTSSREGLALFRSDPDLFDLVITDYTMPYLTGIGLADEIIRIRPDIPIILCTGFIESIDEEPLEEHGIRELLTKPINLHTLATTIQKVLSDRRG
ncbi:MAG: PAS domain S-box protein, partial [Desulfobacteraceae bacterium]|nr:PAS domain S-box protein [Desulfobacteraceae bacterium]